MKIIAKYVAGTKALKTQNRRLYDYLKANGSITRGEAFRYLGIANLWCRISELESGQWGWAHKAFPNTKQHIRRERVRLETSNGVVHVTRYSIQ